MKRLRLIFTTLALCLSIGLMAFGVYSATSVNASLKGSIVYNVEDAFVEIQTKVYKSTTYLNSDQVGQFVNTLSNGDFSVTPEGLTLYGDPSEIYKTTPNEKNYVYGENGELDFKFSDNKQNPTFAYFIVVNIKNLSTENNVWAEVDDSVFDYVSNTDDDSIDTPELESLEIKNLLQVNNDAQPNIDTNGKNIVFALAIDDYVTPITTKQTYKYQINIGSGALAI